MLILASGAAGKGKPAPGSSAGHGKPGFSADLILPGGQGAEPSIAVDTTKTASRGHVYVAAIGDPNGPLEWHSYDGGQTWSQPVPFDLSGPARGGDQDIAVNTNGDLLASDLNITWSSVQISSDGGQTFDAGTQSTPEADRQWLTANGQNVYLAYHDFVAEVPVVCTSLDGGHTFPVCNQTFGPGASISQCAENTVPARALTVDPVTFALSFLYSCSTAAENAQHPPYGPLHDYYLAQSTDGGLTWTTYPVFLADTSNGKAPSYANIFGTLAVDSAGNPDGFPAYNAPNAPAWNVYLAQSTNALASSPTFTQVVADPTPTHYGQICTNGIVCGASDRTLLDYISVGVDCQGYAHLTFGGNTQAQEAAGQTFVHAINQTSGTLLAPPAGC